METTNARSILRLVFCFCLFFSFALPPLGEGEDYYIYRDRNGTLVITN